MSDFNAFFNKRPHNGSEEANDSNSSEKKPFVVMPGTKKYRMSPSQWSCGIRSIVSFVLCQECLGTFKNSSGQPNIMLVACPTCVQFNYRLRFGSDLKPFTPKAPATEPPQTPRQ